MIVTRLQPHFMLDVEVISSRVIIGAYSFDPKVVSLCKIYSLCVRGRGECVQCGSLFSNHDESIPDVSSKTASCPQAFRGKQGFIALACLKVLFIAHLQLLDLA